MADGDPLIPKHGGYRSLRSFQVAQLVYDLTVRFCAHYVDRRSRTHDQMVQAARSGAQNIAEGSQVSGTSRKMEIKLTSVARGSLEELRVDYEDFLRQRSLPLWDRNDPRRADLIARRPAAEADVAAWARDVHSGAIPVADGRSGPSGQSGRRGPGRAAGAPPDVQFVYFVHWVHSARLPRDPGERCCGAHYGGVLPAGPAVGGAV